MDFELGAGVGDRQPNRPTDVAQVCDLLKRVPADKGGHQGALDESDRAAVLAAIKKFQTAFLKELKAKTADGVVGKAGPTLELLYKQATPIAAKVCWDLPATSRFMQADSRWKLVNINNTSSLEYTYWYRACALTAVATAFGAKGIRLPDVDKVKALAIKKHAASKAHEEAAKRKVAEYDIADFGSPTPLTLDAWGTLNASQGYASTVSAELQWEKMAKVSPRISFQFWLEPKDRRFPSPAMLRAWIDASRIVIANVHGGEHFVVLVGYKDEVKFLAFDVGYRAGANQPDKYYNDYTYFTYSDFVLMIVYDVS